MKREDTLINQEFVERGRAMRIDITLPRRVVAFAVRQEGNGIFTIDGMETAERTLRQIRQSVKRTGTRQRLSAVIFQAGLRGTGA